VAADPLSIAGGNKFADPYVLMVGESDIKFANLNMQTTALSFTERSGHCGATSSDH
jgi:hypothetical protein